MSQDGAENDRPRDESAYRDLSRRGTCPSSGSARPAASDLLSQPLVSCLSPWSAESEDSELYRRAQRVTRLRLSGDSHRDAQASGHCPSGTTVCSGLLQPTVSALVTNTCWRASLRSGHGHVVLEDLESMLVQHL